MGATNLTGSRPTPSELSTTAGRVFLISDPMVGSRLTSQISPRFGLRGLVLDNVATLPLFALLQLLFALIVLNNFISLKSEYAAAFVNAQLHECATCFKVRCSNQIFFLNNHVLKFTTVGGSRPKKLI